MFQKLKEENQKLWDKNLSLEKEIEDLKFQVSASALIISEYESKIEMLKSENKKIMKKTSNTSKNNANYATNLIGSTGIEARNQSGTTGFFLKDLHGDIRSAYTSTGTLLADYTYTSWGEERTATTSDWANANPVRYNGQYLDEESGMIYLRARYYDPSLGRFINEDPIKDGWNWHTYCGNNPVNCVDPSGLEEIVVSGGAYAIEEHGGFKYNFIEPAITKIKELRECDENENITWLIADEGWTEDDKIAFSAAVKDLRITVKYVKSSDEVINYINTKDGGMREQDRITKFVVFSHGFTNGSISLGYNYDINYNSNLDIKKSDIFKINGDAFDNPNSWFYSCNTGKDMNSFAKQWNVQVGGYTGAYWGKTDYKNIMYPPDYNKWKDSAARKDIQNKRKAHGFSMTGSYRYPEASASARQVTFGG